MLVLLRSYQLIEWDLLIPYSYLFFFRYLISGIDIFFTKCLNPCYYIYILHTTLFVFILSNYLLQNAQMITFSFFIIFLKKINLLSTPLTRPYISKILYLYKFYACWKIYILVEEYFLFKLNDESNRFT